MMTKQSEEMLAVVLNNDKEITDSQKSRIWDILRGVEDEPVQSEIRPLYTRKEAAALLKKTPQMVDYYANKGLLKKVAIGNASRASGITEESLMAVLNGECYPPLVNTTKGNPIWLRAE